MHLSRRLVKIERPTMNLNRRLLSNKCTDDDGDEHDNLSRRLVKIERAQHQEKTTTTMNLNRRLLFNNKCTEDDDEHDNKHDEEECLVVKKGDYYYAENDEPETAAQFSFPVRALATIVLLFLGTSHLLLVGQCAVSVTKQKREVNLPHYHDGMINEFQVISKKNVSIWSSSKDNAGIVTQLTTGDVITTLGEARIVDYGKKQGKWAYHFVLKPQLGFVEQNLNRSSLLQHVNSLDDVNDDIDDAWCPLLYEGFWDHQQPETTHVDAPISLIIAQQLWNATQVFTLFLLAALYYWFVAASNSPATNRYQYRIPTKIATILLVLASLGVLPVSSQLISPGAHMFAVLTSLTLVVAFFWTPPGSMIRVSLQEGPSCCGTNNRSTSPTKNKNHNHSWTWTREETLACCCNLGSSLYNYAGSTAHWPHWKVHFRKIDDYFGWPTSGNVFWDEAFTLGLQRYYKYVPLFVPRATGGSTVGATQFFMVWSILPTCYILYFTCMFLLSHRSPGKWIQRCLCIFGICHFLFGTDVIAYRYGRGYYAPHGELFHWFEKIAWRIAMLLPVYQNITNGHWHNNHHDRSFIKTLVRISLLLWAIFFVLFQVIQSDVMKFTQFLLDQYPLQGLIPMWGLDETFFFQSSAVQYPYRESLILMIFWYGPFLHISGLWPLFHIQLSRVSSSSINSEWRRGKGRNES